MSESDKVQQNEKLKSELWNYVYNLTNKTTTSFLYGVKLNTLYDFINKTNYNKFIDWDDFFNSKLEDII
jgi:hypothetical protein